MRVDQLREQLEMDLAWRQDEIRFLHNLCAGLAPADQQEKFRRAMVVMLYSHFEGFFKFAFTSYVSAINEENLSCKDANLTLAAASLANVFRFLRDGNGKVPELENMSLPEDKELYRFARDKEFLSQAKLLMDKPVKIPLEVVNTESNLKTDVLRTILYRLGFPHDHFSGIESDVQLLLRLRNNIAHGGTKDGISEALYEKLKSSVLHVMSTITSQITEAFAGKRFLATVQEVNLPSEAQPQ